MYTPEQIQPYLDDHRRVRGATDKYICPLSLQPCELGELSRGHIVNDALGYEFNSTVPVKTDVDGFFGSRVEPSFIDYLKLNWQSGLDMLLSQRKLEIKFRTDGPTYQAFVVLDAEVEEKAKHLRVYELYHNSKKFHVGIKGVNKDDAALPKDLFERPEISWGRTFMPSHWTATALKMAYLTVFKLVGYNAPYDPCTDAIRRVLMQYFHDNGTREEAPTYFRRYQNAMRVAYAGAKDGPDRKSQVDMDTLRDNNVICHYSDKHLFAISVIYKIKDKTMLVSLPQCLHDADIVAATALYDRMLSLDNTLRQQMIVTNLAPDGWKALGTINARNLEDTETN